MGNLHWETKLSATSENGIRIRGYDLVQLIGTVPFPSVLYLLFTGELPAPNVAKLIDAIMVASIDHGAGAPSALAARTAASGGASLGAAAAAGLLTLGKYHGAAVQEAMEAIQQVIEISKTHGNLDHAAETVVADWRQVGRRLAGFGHRQHKHQDPRLPRLFQLAREANLRGDYLQAARALEGALKRATGKELPINIDGATAAILCEIGFPPSLSNALFMVARIAGILAHANEEIAEMPPMRRIDPVDHGYAGPVDRVLPISQLNDQTQNQNT
jgi:citrate synthase